MVPRIHRHRYPAGYRDRHSPHFCDSDVPNHVCLGEFDAPTPDADRHWGESHFTGMVVGNRWRNRGICLRDPAVLQDRHRSTGIGQVHAYGARLGGLAA